MTVTTDTKLRAAFHDGETLRTLATKALRAKVQGEPDADLQAAHFRLNLVRETGLSLELLSLLQSEGVLS